VRAVSRLLWTFIVRPLRRDLIRTVLTIVSVALGVAVVIAIELAGQAAVGSFRSSLETLLGKTDLQITANGGVDEVWVARLAQLPRNLRAAPVIELQAVVEGIGAVPVYGVDLLPQGRAAGHGGGLAVSNALARRLGIQSAGSRLALQINDTRREFPVATIVDAKDSEFALLDIADAQQAAGSYGKLDRIDIFVSPREDFARLEAEIRAMLPASYSLDKPGVRGEENQRMLRAFRWNLRVLSYISLVVGAFLIYNTISVSVVRRRPEIGILRALGAGSLAVLSLFLGEALLLGLAGALAGVLLGRILAEATVAMIADTVNSIYTSSRPAQVELTLGAVITGLVAGAAVALVSALAPAREAMAVTPVSAMGRGAHERQARLHWGRRLIWAALLAVAALLASRARPVEGQPLWGYAAALLAVGSASFAAPAVTLLITKLTRNAMRRFFGAEGMLAGRGLAASLSRTSVIVAALATAIAMMASVGIMVGSFRETVLVWLDQQLRADLYVRPSGRSGAGQFPALSPQAPGLVAAVDGVEAVDIFHGLEFRYGGQRATLGAGNIDIVRRHGRLRFLPSGQDRDSILRSLPHQDRAIVSEPFANKHGVRPGDKITLPLGAHAVPITVAGVYYDYSSELGWVILDRSTLLKYLPDQPVTNLAVYLKPGVDATAARRRIEAAISAYRIVVAENKTLRSAAVVVFDRTFAITYALEAVAIIVAMLGAANSLLALVLDRRREFGLLRFLGAAPAQLRRLVLIEAAFLGLLADLLGLALGFVLSLLLIYVVNKQSFGWTIQFHPPVSLLAGALTLIWLATVAAGLYPARVASRLNPIEVVHLE
jgi:putative ABC transport system permease protein